MRVCLTDGIRVSQSYGLSTSKICSTAMVALKWQRREGTVRLKSMLTSTVLVYILVKTVQEEYRTCFVTTLKWGVITMGSGLWFVVVWMNPVVDSPH